MASIGPDGVTRASKVAAGSIESILLYSKPTGQDLEKNTTEARQRRAESPTQPAFLTPPEYASADTTEFSSTVGKGTVFNPSLKGPEIP